MTMPVFSINVRHENGFCSVIIVYFLQIFPQNNTALEGLGQQSLLKNCETTIQRQRAVTQNSIGDRQTEQFDYDQGQIIQKYLIGVQINPLGTPNLAERSCAHEMVITSLLHRFLHTEHSFFKSLWLIRTTVRNGYHTVRPAKMYVNFRILTYMAKWDVPCMVQIMIHH